MEKARAWLRKYWIAAAAGAVVLLLLIAFLLGLRVSPTGITRAGTIEITGVPADTRVYIDEARLVHAPNGTARITLLPGMHSVIVDVTDMQPWNELVEVVPGETTVVTPISVPKTVIKERLPQEEYAAARDARRAHALPTAAAPLLIQDGCVSVYASGNRILAAASTSPSCTPPAFLECLPDGSCPAAQVFSPSAMLRSIAPYPGRGDALVVAAGTLSYVVELDPRDPQFFAPLVKNSLLYIAPWQDNSVLIDEAGVYSRIEL